MPARDTTAEGEVVGRGRHGTIRAAIQEQKVIETEAEAVDERAVTVDMGVESWSCLPQNWNSRLLI